MCSARLLIVNADDFGQSCGVNRGIIQAHEKGIVTSASLMVRWPAAVEAAAYAREHPSLSLGLHVDLGEWAFRDGEWKPLYSVVPAEDAHAVEAEIERQFDAFHRLVDRNPTHADSHQYIHRSEPVGSILTGITNKLGIPLRDASAVQYRGDFYGQTVKGQPWRSAITVDALLKILEELPSGITELGCHPGYGSGLDTMYVHEREMEVASLCDKRVRQAVESNGIVLCSFHEVASTARR